MSKWDDRPTYGGRLANHMIQSRPPEPTPNELAEAKDLSVWAGRQIPNSAASGALKYGYNVEEEYLTRAIALIVRRVRSMQ